MISVQGFVSNDGDLDFMLHVSGLRILKTREESVDLGF